jgi:hypothetical protein
MIFDGKLFNKMDYCVVCDEVTRDGLLTDDMKPICQLCYNDVRIYRDTKFSCNFETEDQRGDLKKCGSYERSLKLLNKSIDERKIKVKRFAEDLEIQYLLYPEARSVGRKKLEIAQDIVDAEEEVLKKTEDILKASCDTKNPSQLKRVEQFIKCHTQVPLDLISPLPKGEPQFTTNNYQTERFIGVFKTTFDGKVLFQKSNELHQFLKKDGKVESKLFFEAPSGYLVDNVSRNAIWVRNLKTDDFKVYDRKKEEVATFKISTYTQMEYVPATSSKPALIIVVKYGDIDCFMIDNGDLKLKWAFESYHVKSHSLFSSSLLLLSRDRLFILDVDTGEILWERPFNTEKFIKSAEINMADGRVHYVEEKPRGFVTYTILDLFGKENKLKTPLEKFSQILGAIDRPLRYRITINPDTGKTYLFAR